MNKRSSIDFFPSKTLDTTKQNLKANSGYTKFSKGRQEVRSLLVFISLYKQILTVVDTEVYIGRNIYKVPLVTSTIAQPIL
jgi:hypothetical protein